MAQEEKELLLKDLCAMLSYDVVVEYEGNNYILETVNRYDEVQLIGCNFTISYYECKPYLRSMSSMTEEEKKDLLATIVGNEGVKYFQVLSDGSIDNTDATIQDPNNFNMHWVNFDKDTVTLYLDWCNKNHFDYRGLIEKGLAIEVTEENNPY